MTEFVVGLVIGVAGVTLAIYQTVKGRKAEDLLRQILDAVEDQHPEATQAVADEIVGRLQPVSPQSMVASVLSEARRALPDRERAVLLMRYVEQMTLADIGAQLNLTREEVRRIEDDALRRLARGPWLRQAPRSG